jgi:hypothetical protein
MAITTLKWIRLIVPGVLLYLLAVLFCWTSTWCHLAIPDTYGAITGSITGVVLGAIYYALSLSKFANQDYFDRVGQNLVCQLTLPFIDDPDFPRDLTWRQVKHVFYPYVDNDKSLEHQKILAFWNGAFWTSAADLRMVSGIGVCFFALIMLAVNLIGGINFDNFKATWAILLLVVLFFLSIGLSELTTRKHIKIGTYQAKHIRLQYRDELRAKLIAAGSDT